jgi:double-stranded uracil-DNA glycosylase
VGDHACKAGFPPVTGPNTRLLVLGSLPGDASLEAGQYYAHPRNAFWRLMGTVVERDLVDLPYPARLNVLRASGVGLWDVIARAERRGSLDQAIRNAEDADLRRLIASLPALRAVAFNGATAANIGRRTLAGVEGLTLVDLPSSSPAHASRSFADKAEAWSVLKSALAD